MKKLLYISLLLLLCLSCSEDENPSGQNPNTPLITILPITEVAGDFAKTGAELIDNNGFSVIRKGICYSTAPNPTVDDIAIDQGDGTSGFETELTGIDFETTYFVRAYAESSEGIGYSEELTFTTNTICFTNLFDGGITLATQSEVNDFAANYCGITGNLTIDDSGTTSDFITDLTPLLAIRQVGSLEISSTNNLQSLDGLENIDSVNSIDLSQNANLENIDALSRISEVDFLKIFQNPKLRNLDALQLTKADINIGDNELLENINGLSSLQETGELFISKNPLLTNINALSNLTKVNSVSITENNSLQNLNGFSGVTEVLDGSIIINFNPSLTNIGGLGSCTSISGNLQLSFNDNLTNLNGLNSIQTITGDLEAQFNPALNNLCGLTTVIQANGLSGSYIVNDNAFNPTQQDMIDGNCSQ